MTPVRLEPASPRYRDKHSTTAPLRSLMSMKSAAVVVVFVVVFVCFCCCFFIYVAVVVLFFL